MHRRKRVKEARFLEKGNHRSLLKCMYLLVVVDNI